MDDPQPVESPRSPAGQGTWNLPLLVAGFACWAAIALIFLHLFGILIFAKEQVPLKAIQPEQGLAYTAPYGGEPVNWPWNKAATLNEDGKPIGPGNQLHDAVRGQGHGRFSAWAGTVYFSSSDGTNPAANGRAYLFERPWPVPLFVPGALTVISLVLILFAAPGANLASRARTAFGVSTETLPILLSAGIMLYFRPWTLLHEFKPLNIGIVAAFAVAGLLVNAKSLPKAVLYILRFIAAMFAFMLLTRAPDFVASEGIQFTQFDWTLRILGAAAAIGSWWRPSLVIVTFACHGWTNTALRLAYDGLPVDGAVDWLPMMEITAFVLMTIIGVQLVLSAASLIRRTSAPAMAAESGRLEGLVFIASGIHMANYAYSGMAKLSLDGGPLSWITENQTFWMYTNAKANGVAPLGSLGVFSDWVGSGMEASNALINISTLGSQLLGFVLVAFPPVASVLFVIYDIFHAGIAVLTGIVFWEWALMNVAFIAAFRSFKIKLNIQTRLVAILTCALAPTVFTTIALGWYDTPAVNVVAVEANLKDGSTVPVPSNFFRQHSFAATSSYSWQPGLMANMLPTDTWGTTDEHAVSKQMKACAFSTEWPKSELPPDAKILYPGFFALIGDLHRAAEKAQGSLMPRPQMIYPHHIVSDPFGYPEYSKLRFQDVSSYTVHVRAICHDLETLEPRIYADAVVGRVQVSPPLE